MSQRAFALGAIPAALWFTLRAAPSVAFRDAGELTAASFLLDVAHPTGFPADVLLVRLAMLVPLGDLALRANLAVASLMALACGCASVLAFRLVPTLAPTARLAVSALPAAALMASSTVLRAATAMEVYAGSLLLSLAALTLTGGSAPAPVRARLAALALGLSLATHATSRPAALVALDVAAWPSLRRPRSVAALVALAVVGALAVAYLPLASLRDGPIDWGDPQTPARFVEHLTARSIRASYAGRIMVAWRLPEDLGAALRTLVDDLGAPLSLLSLVGVGVAARRRAAWPVLAVTVADLAYSAAINPMGTSDRQTLFVTEAGMAVLAALALGSLLSRLPGRRRAELSIAVAVGVVVATLARVEPRWSGAADRWAASEIPGGAGALGLVAARAVVLCNSDDACGGAMYAQWVEGERPDVTVLPHGSLHLPTTWRRLDVRSALLRRDEAPSAREQRLRWLLARAGERVRWEGDGREVPWLRLSPGETPVFARVGAPAGDTSIDREAVSWVLPRLPPLGLAGVGAQRLGATALFAAGAREGRGGLERAAPLWRAALGVWPDHAAAWTNLAVAEARAGRVREAVVMTRRALDLEPERPRAWRNLAEYLAALGDREGAAEAAREAGRRTP